MLIREIMKRELVTVEPSTTAKEAAWKMKEQNVGCILVTERGQLKGILTDRDIALFVVANGKDPSTLKVSEFMKTDVVTAKPDTDVFYASRLMAEKQIRRLPIQSNGTVEGILSVSDLAHFLKEEVDNLLTLEEASVYHRH